MSKHFDVVNFPRHETLRLMAGYLQGVIEKTDKMPESRTELTRFHAKSIPTIDILAYLNRILKYAPCENDCFLSVLVYFNRMATLQNKPPSFVSSCKKRRKPIIINSYNIHRLLIIGIMIAAKFYSDIFFTNSHYAKVGGLPVLELNQLEIEFLLINDFDLHISVEDIQETGDLLLNHALKYPLKIIVNPTNDLKLIKSNQAQQQQQQQQKQPKEMPVPPRVTQSENEESNRRHSRIQPQPVANSRNNNSTNPTVNNNNTNSNVQYNIQFNNSTVPVQNKRTSAYEEFNRDIIDTAADAIDSFDNNEPIQKYGTLNTASLNHRSPIPNVPNVYTLQRTTSKTASAKLRNSLIMSMNSNIPLSSNYSSSTVSDNSMVNNNSNVNYRYSLQQPMPNMQQHQQHQQQQMILQQQQQQQQQLLQHHHPVYYSSPVSMEPQPPQPPQAVLMDSQYNAYMYEQQQQQQQQQHSHQHPHQHQYQQQQPQHLQQQEMAKKYEVQRLSTSQSNKMPMGDPNNQYMMYQQNGIPANMSYSTGDLYNPKRMSASSYGSSLVVNYNNGNTNGNNSGNNPPMNGYKQPLKSKSSSTLGINDWHNKELPPIKVHTKQGSNSSNLSVGNPHSANDILYQQMPSQGQPKPVPPIYTNSPIKMNNNTSSNRLSINNSHNGSGQFDSPLDAPPRLSKFFGYMPSEVISPIKITDEYQQDIQKMEDMTNNFYLSPLTNQSAHSPSISHTFSNLHISSNPSSAANTPHRSYNNSASTTPNNQPNILIPPNGIPSGNLSGIMDPSIAISPLAAKASALSLSPTNTNTNTNTNRPYSLIIDPKTINPVSLNSPVSAKSLNKHFSVQVMDRKDRGISLASSQTLNHYMNNLSQQQQQKPKTLQPSQSQPQLKRTSQYQYLPSTLPRSKISNYSNNNVVNTPLNSNNNNPNNNDPNINNNINNINNINFISNLNENTSFSNANINSNINMNNNNNSNNNINNNSNIDSTINNNDIYFNSNSNSDIESFPNQNNIQLYINKSTMSKNYR